MRVCLCEFIGAMHEGTCEPAGMGSPGAAVTPGCELSDAVLEPELRSSSQAVLITELSSPQPHKTKLNLLFILVAIDILNFMALIVF